MAMETSAAEVTVNVTAGLTTLPNVAVICEVPVPTAVAKPGVVVLNVATERVCEDHVTFEVMSCVDLSLYVPVAVNCCVAPLAIEGLAGATAMDCRVGAVTVNVTAGLTTLPKVAVICEVPTPTPVARPGVVELNVATDGVWEPQVTLAVMF